MDVFDLVAKITLDSSEYDKGLDGASNKAQGFGNMLKGGLAGAAKAGGVALAAVGAAGIAATTAFVKGAAGVAAYGDNIDKMSQKMGMSASAYQEWDAVMQHSGTSMETMKASMKTLANAAETGSEAFTKLGISQEELANMSQEQLFERTISALQNVEDETERTYLAGKTLGRGATELGALLNTSAEDTQKMRDRVHELGGVMSDDAVKAAAAYQDSLQDMRTAMSGISRGMLSEMLPSMTKVMDGLTEIFAGNSDKGIGLVTEGINGVFGKINEAVPKFLQIGGSIVKALGKALVSNIPNILSAGAKIITSLITGVLSAVPGLINAGIQMGGQLVDAISAALNERFPALGGAFDSLVEIAGNAIQAIKDFWAENGEEILAKASEVWENVKTAVSTAVEAIGVVIQTVIDVAKELWDTWGSDLVAIATSYWEMISLAISTAVTTIQEIITTVVTAISEFWAAHGETIMAAASAAWGVISTVISGALSIIQGIIAAVTAAIQGNWSGVWSAILGILSTIWSTIQSVVSAAIGAVASVISSILSRISSIFSTVWNTIKTTVTNVINAVKSTISSGISAAYSTVSNVLNNIRSKFTSIFNTVKSTVLNAINTIKGAFNFSWSLPPIKLPHISIEGSFSLNPPSVPHFGISWYQKAMDNAYMLNGATIFGSMGGRLLGGGETGKEILIGESKAIDLIRKASGDREPVNVTINVYARENQDVNALADVISRKLQKQLDRRSAVYA